MGLATCVIIVIVSTGIVEGGGIIFALSPLSICQLKHDQTHLDGLTTSPLACIRLCQTSKLA